MIHKPEGFRGRHERRSCRETIPGAGDGFGSDFWIVPSLLLRAAAGDGFAAGPGEDRRDEVRSAIRKMEDEGMLVAEDAVHGSLAGRRYAITEQGEAYLRSWAGFLERERRASDVLLKAYADRRSDRGLAWGLE